MSIRMGPFGWILESTKPRRLRCRSLTLLVQLVANLPRNNDWYRACVRLLAFWGSWVRTLSTILLTIMMGLPMASPLFALGEKALPACCRREGKHRCMHAAGSVIKSGSTPFLSSALTKCPNYPKALTVTAHSRVGLIAAAAVFAAVVSHPAIPPQTVCNCRISAARAHQKRGPPPSTFC